MTLLEDKEDPLALEAEQVAKEAKLRFLESRLVTAETAQRDFEASVEKAVAEEQRIQDGFIRTVEEARRNKAAELTRNEGLLQTYESAVRISGQEVVRIKRKLELIS